MNSSGSPRAAVAGNDHEPQTDTEPPVNTRGPAIPETDDEPQESGGLSTMIRFIFLVGLVLIGAALLVHWKGHHTGASNAEAPAPQAVAVQSGQAPQTSVTPPPSAVKPPGTTSRQLAYDPALSTNEIAAIYAKVTTTIDDERANRPR